MQDGSDRMFYDFFKKQIHIPRYLETQLRLNLSTPSKGFFGLFVSVPVELCVIKMPYSLGHVDLILIKIPKTYLLLVCIN